MAQETLTEYYVAVGWSIDRPGDPRTAELDKSIHAAFRNREYIEIIPRLAVIAVSNQNDRQRLLGALRYLAETQWSGAISYAASGLIRKPLLWTGWANTDWDKVNEITRTRDTSPS